MFFMLEFCSELNVLTFKSTNTNAGTGSNLPPHANTEDSKNILSLKEYLVF
jgi:hypothetical protein